MRCLTAAAVAATLLGGSAPLVSGAVLRGGGSWGAALTEALATPSEDGEEREASSAMGVEPDAGDAEDVKEGAADKPWLVFAATSWRNSMADAPRKVLVRLGLMQTAAQPPAAVQGSVEPHIVIDNGIDDKEVREQQLLAQMIVGLVSVAVWTALTALIADYYLKKKVQPDVSVDPGAAEALSSFRYGPFDCLSRMDISLWVFCCPAIRWADNISSIGLLRSFWLAFAIFLGFQMVTGEAQDLVAWIVLAVIGAGFRQELRLKFQMARDGMTFLQDTLLYCCCPCCAITQEARQVEEAVRMGHPAVVKPTAEAEEAGEAAA